jgi:membrane protein
LEGLTTPGVNPVEPPARSPAAPSPRLPPPGPPRTFLRLHLLIQRAILSANSHDWLNLAQSCAYSAIVSLFPALIVAAAVVSLTPDTTPIRSELSTLFDRVLPSDVSPLLQSYFVASAENERSARFLIFAAIVSFTGASSVIATFMEGIRRAHHLPMDCWSFWERRRRAFLLVLLSLFPLAIVSLLVVFGHFLVVWLGLHADPEIRTPVYIIAFLFRWSVALTGSVATIAVIYHMGTPLQQPWKSTLPGAIAATLMWFLSTLMFGWYVTRFANYSLVYGSLGAGIALLFWLYIISLSVLFGAEFNMQFHSRHSSRSTLVEPPADPQSPG